MRRPLRRRIRYPPTYIEHVTGQRTQCHGHCHLLRVADELVTSALTTFTSRTGYRCRTPATASRTARTCGGALAPSDDSSRPSLSDITGAAQSTARRAVSASSRPMNTRYAYARKADYGHGYKVHLTETCEADTPNLITHIETTKSTEQDNMAVTGIHTALETAGLLPAQHIVDSRYMSAELRIDSQTQHNVDLLGPVRPDVH